MRSRKPPGSCLDTRRFVIRKRAFATLPGFIDYCAALSSDARELRRRYQSLERFPVST